MYIFGLPCLWFSLILESVDLYLLSNLGTFQPLIPPVLFQPHTFFSFFWNFGDMDTRSFVTDPHILEVLLSCFQSISLSYLNLVISIVVSSSTLTLFSVSFILLLNPSTELFESCIML